MKRSPATGLGLAVGALGCTLAGLAAQTSGTVDVSHYPPDVQKEYRVFADKCSRCHDLSRPLSAKYTTPAQWQAMVARMARKPGAGISPKDQTAITSFLVYYHQSQTGSTAPSADTGTPAPAPSAGSAPPAPAGNPEVNLAPPAARTGSAASPLQGSTEGGGLRVEVEALPAQPLVMFSDGRWSTQGPSSGDNLFLSVRLIDAVTGEKVPYATVLAQVGTDPARPAKPLQPLFGAHGFEYGANFDAPAGDLVVSLRVEPPALARVNDDGHRWTSPLNLKLTLHGR